MKRSNQILAGIVASIFALACLAVLYMVPDAPTTWVLAGFAGFALIGLYNFAPVTMGDFFGEARETVSDVRNDD